MNKKADLHLLEVLRDLIIAALILFIILVPTVYLIRSYYGADECPNQNYFKSFVDKLNDIENQKQQEAETFFFNKDCYIITFTQNLDYNEIKPPENKFTLPFICLCNINKGECNIDSQEMCIGLKTFDQIGNTQFSTKDSTKNLFISLKREDKNLLLAQGGYAEVITVEETTNIKITNEQCKASTGSSEMKALLDTIAWAEGADYNTMYGGEKFSDFSAHPVYTGEMPKSGITKWGRTSTAAGRYQFLKDTYDNEKKLGFFSTGFIQDEQDKAAIDLITRKKSLTEEQLKTSVEANNLRPVWDKLMKEWASIPTKDGKSYYGQSAKTEEQLKLRYYECYQQYKGAPQPLITAQK